MTVERSAPWPAGTPNWVGLAATDAAAATKFYADVFGWYYEPQGAPEYWFCRLDGQDVGGIGPKQPGTEHLPSHWTTYLATDHLERTLDSITSSGGTHLTPPQEIPPYGRTAIAADPNSAVFGLWQAGDHIGTDRRADPGMLVWSEALCDDYETSKAFYISVFGYRHEEVGVDGGRYAALYIDDKPVAGTGDIHPDFPAGPQAYWLPYFATDDTDGTVERVRRGGGRLLDDPLETDFGRMAVLADPEDALFAVIQLG